MISLQQIRQVAKAYSRTIPEEFRDEMGHMNVQYYVHLFDMMVRWLYGQAGLTDEFMVQEQVGSFALEQHLRYLAEVQIGAEVSLYPRILGLSPKRIHIMGFMLNDTQEKLASTIEVVGMNIDMRQRRGAPFLPQIAANLDAIYQGHAALEWSAPVCGFMKP